MFKWLAKRFGAAREEEPLASEKGIETFIAALPVIVPTRTLDTLGEPFAQARSLALTPSELRRALKRLDERAQAVLDVLWPELFEGADARRISESCWLALTSFHRNLTGGYRAALEANSAAQESDETARADVVLLAVRTMAAAARLKLLLRMRYRDVDPGYWDFVHGLGAWGRTAGIDATLTELYPGRGYMTALQREYLIALAFEAAPIGNLLPPQMVALDLVLRRVGAQFHIGDEPRETAPFLVEPGREPCVQRWLKGLSRRPGQRFFGFGSAYGHVLAFRKQAHDVPDWLGWACIDLKSYQQLLDLLLQHWSAQPPQRRQRRERADGEILVSHGVGQVRRMIAASRYAQSGRQFRYDASKPYDFAATARFEPGNAAAADASEGETLTPLELLQRFELEGDRQMTERWTLTDVSATGFGALAAAHGGWGRTGMLIGFRRPDSLDWRIAVIRRLNRTAQGRLSIGASIVPGESAYTRVRLASGDPDNPWVAVAGTTDVDHDAILLKRDPVTLVMLEAGVFEQALDCMISLEGRWHPARLERCVEQGYDYELIEATFAPP